MRIHSLENSRQALPLQNPPRTNTDRTPASGDDKLREVCEQFEAFFTAQLLKNMRESGNFEGFLKQSRAETIFGAQRDAELCKHLAGRGSLGIAKLLYSELKPRLEATSDSTEDAAA